MKRSMLNEAKTFVAGFDDLVSNLHQKDVERYRIALQRMMSPRGFKPLCRDYELVYKDCGELSFRAYQEVMRMEDLLRVGDDVVINVPDETWREGYRPLGKQKGTSARIAGFGEVTVGRVDINDDMRPGVYVNRAWPYVVIGEGLPLEISSYWLELKDQKEYERRVAEWQDEYKAKAAAGLPVLVFAEEEYLRELPKTPFWEGDWVRVYRPCPTVCVVYGDVDPDFFKAMENGKKLTEMSPPERLMVERICWDTAVDGHPTGYLVSTSFWAGWCAHVNETDMRLIERGDVWRYYHGQPLNFGSVAERARFFRLLGHFTNIRNPNTGFFAWQEGEADEAIRAAIADGLAAEGSYNIAPLGEPHAHPIRFRDRVLGELVRQATLAGSLND